MNYTCVLGDISTAIVAARDAVQHSIRSEDLFQQISQKTALLNALHQAGEMDEASSLFSNIEALRLHGDPKYQISTRYRDTDYAISYRHLKNTKRSRLVLRRALKRGTNKRDCAGWVWIIWCLALRSKREAREGAPHINTAIELLRASGDLGYLTLGLLARAEHARKSLELSGARRDLTEALDVASRCQMKLHLADCYLEQARLYMSQKLYRDAAQSTMAASALISQTGYNRRKPELVEISEKLSQVRNSG